ncbi:MAG: hypothetical protein VKL59_23075 [Nostocaceae cyanobacterium]|nr:hypothetical protein [Nostocaceae cyanobacterium]
MSTELPTPRKSALQRRPSPATVLSKAAGQPPVIQPVVKEPSTPASQPFTVSELEIISSPTEVHLPSQSL